MSKKLRIFSLLLAIAILFTACGQPSTSTTPTNEEPAKEESKLEDQKYKAAFITSTPRGNEFVDLIWSGFQTLEKEKGWEIKCIETFETAEHSEQIRALCAEGYNLIYTNGDDIMMSAHDLKDEIADLYPDVYFFFLDTYKPTEMPNSTTVTIDPFESCFIAGYVAANKTETGKIGLMLPLDTAIMRRFQYGYYAGVDYANKDAEVVTGYTTDWVDTTKGYEATTAMKSNNDIDVLFQAAYISGYGVISACADLELPCIGVDDWQGDIDPIVFWSAIKSMDFAVTRTAEMWENKEELPIAMELNLADGGYAYAEVDMKNLSPELAEAVEKLKDDIISGEVDVFAGEYEEWRITNLTESGE